MAKGEKTGRVNNPPQAASLPHKAAYKPSSVLKVQAEGHLNDTRSLLHGGGAAEIRIVQIDIDTAERSSIEQVRNVGTEFHVRSLLDCGALHQRERFGQERRIAHII